ncbi:acyltransferase domain-containing protein [Actinosynnema sp. NPDC047251]|uniref:acyltransferase domain-containing protein n=1 Tax=Saccharothrix espanaensis TaxID=103731 RepID=UPI00130E8957|nr:acyltransferase domain-containing protein [Saccharothrix espanaensis]
MAVIFQAIDEACTALNPHLPQPLQDVVFGDGIDTLDRTEYAQSAIFTVETALFRFCQHRGINPSVHIGHSISEITAAHISDSLTLPHAARLITHPRPTHATTPTRRSHGFDSGQRRRGRTADRRQRHHRLAARGMPEDTALAERLDDGAGRLAANP